MSFEAFLDHKCDVRHLIESAESPGYELPASPAFNYPAEPDITDLACHFGIRSGNITITQNEPKNEMDAKIKLTFPYGADIRRGDKITDKATGLDYTAEQPRTVRQHHAFVYIGRRMEQRAL